MHMKLDATAPAANLLARMVILALLWWLIAEGQPAAWLIGLPAVALAAVASIHLGEQALPRLSFGALPGFAALFLRESLRGGLDVARRILAARLRIQPGFRSYRMQIQDPRARVLLVNCISLLPGTLAAELDGDRVALHLLDTRDDPDPELLRLEQAIARLFGLPMETGHV
jgi:multicomponent Na+:H+ antiporter subunit E